MAKLIVNPTSSAKREIPLPKSILSIGRDPSNDLVLPDAMVSRRHAVIEFRGSQFYLRDCNSSNGSLVNGDRVSERSLRDGDLVSIGTARLLFRDDAGEEHTGKVIQHPSAPRLQCPSCSAEYRKGDAFCRHCGTQVAASVPARVVCTACGTAVPLPARFCNACGRPLGRVDAGGLPAVESPTPAGTPALAATPASILPAAAPAPPSSAAEVPAPAPESEPEGPAGASSGGTPEMNSGAPPLAFARSPRDREAGAEASPAHPLTPPTLDAVPRRLRAGAPAAMPAVIAPELPAPERDRAAFAHKGGTPAVEAPVPRRPVAAIEPARPLPAAARDDVRPAGFGRRLLAGLADSAIVGLAASALMVPVGLYWWTLAPPRDEAPFGVVLLSVSVAAVGGLLAAGYYVHSWASRGATPGQRLLELVVVGEDGACPIGGSRAVARLLGYVLSGAVLGVGFLMVAVDGIGLHDRIAGTRVIRRRRN